MSIAPALTSAADVYVPALSGADLDLLRSLVDQWQRKLPRNLTRKVYYDAKNRLRDLGISIPPQLKAVETVVGWPSKAVDALAHRVVFDGFVLPGDQEDPYGLMGVFADNRMAVELPQAVTSSLTHSVVFMSTMQGDTEAGEPEILVQARSALYGTGLWDRNRRSLRAYLSISDANPETGEPTEMVMHLPDRVGHIVKSPGGRWSVMWRPNPTGRVLVEPLVHRPDLDRPFGRSRISRPVMSLTDEAVRTVLRTEVSAEFYAAPQRYILGVEEEAFGPQGPGWKSILGRIFSLNKDPDGDTPTVGQFPQQSMQPHTDMLRSIAARFASETSLPLASLGIVQDNPSSAEAIYAAKEDLVIEAQDTAVSFGAGLVQVGKNIVRLRDGRDSDPDELRGLQANWQNPATPSVVSAADAVVKQVAAVPWLAESPLVLKRMGYTQAEIVQLLADKRRASGGSLIDRALSRAPASRTPEQGADSLEER